MTDIKNINESLKTALKPQGTQKQDTDGDLFRETFEKVMSDKKDKAPPVSTLPPLQEIQPVNMNVINSSPEEISEKTEGLLNLLDRYVKELTDPEKSLRDIEPLIQEARTHADELSDVVGRSGSDNPQLKEIADRSALAANVEYIKFMRGDYV